MWGLRILGLPKTSLLKFPRLLKLPPTNLKWSASSFHLSLPSVQGVQFRVTPGDSWVANQQLHYSPQPGGGRWRLPTPLFSSREGWGTQQKTFTFSGNNLETAQTTSFPSHKAELIQAPTPHTREAGKCSPYSAATLPEKTQRVGDVTKRRKGNGSWGVKISLCHIPGLCDMEREEQFALFGSWERWALPHRNHTKQGTPLMEKGEDGNRTGHSRYLLQCSVTTFPKTKGP